jgi:phosphatidylglycerol:prolipoprotein diacylglycerol transferase
MHPRIFGLVKSYGLLLAISFVVGAWLSVRRGRARGLSADTVLDLVFAVLVASIVGVRLFYVVTHLEEFQPWYRVFMLWDGGLTLYGGIVFAILAVWWQARRRGIAFLVVADVMAPAVVLGIGITRIGCFLAGCCYGRPTACPLGVHFPPGAPATERFGLDVAVHPSQLYSSAGGFAIFALLLWWERRPAPAGATFFRFLLLYGVHRFLVDFTRQYAPDQLWSGLSNNQWISLALAACGLLALVGPLRRRVERRA